MNLYVILLKLLLKKSLYQKYYSFLEHQHIKDNYPELHRLYCSLANLHDSGDVEQRTVADLQLSFLQSYPRANPQDYAPLFTQLEAATFDEDQAVGYLDKVQQQAHATRIAQTALGVAEGNVDYQELLTTIGNAPQGVEAVPDESDFVSDDLELLLHEEITTPGLRWPIPSLNRNLGSLRTGDFGFLFARPETGKTTFLATIVPYMAAQSEQPVIWFNNEERGGKVQLRIYQSALALRREQLLANIEANKARYFELTKGNIKLIADPSLTKKRVEEVCEKYKPSLIIFDQIDKIHGFKKEDRPDIELKHIYIWARELAKKYAPVIGVCQAGATGEGKRWLTMADVDNSKTGKQGEADWILGIGKVADEGLETVRYLHLSKNKLIGDSDSDPAMRHGKWEVRIRPEIARYEDF